MDRAPAMELAADGPASEVSQGVPPGAAVEHVDVVVVGGGGSGLAAASAAARLGRSVVLLEKGASLGGSTAWSVGSVSATNTPHQRAAGIRDNPRDHWEDMALFSGVLRERDNPQLARLLADQAPEAFDWLLSTGLRFVGPMPEPPHRRPRMHNVLPNSRAFPARLGRDCRRLGVRIELRSTARALIAEGGRITGVLALGGDGRLVAWIARGGVVLAAGDFSASAPLKARLAPERRVERVDPINPGCTGDGLLLGLAAGGEILNGDHLRGPFLRFVPPPRDPWLSRLPPHPALTSAMRWAYERLPARLLRPFLMGFVTTALAPEAALFRSGALLVDRDGRPVHAEAGGHHAAVAAAPDGLAWLVFDARIAAAFSGWPNFVSTAPGVAYAYLDDYRRTRPDLLRSAGTPHELARRTGLPGEALARSLSAHRWPDDSGAARPAEPPYFALGPAKAYVVFTNGGLAVSEHMQVLRADRSPIAGLFAAGSNGQGGLLLEGHGHHLMWAFVSGRIAGRAAAYEATTAAGTDRPAATGASSPSR